MILDEWEIRELIRQKATRLAGMVTGQDQGSTALLRGIVDRIVVLVNELEKRE